MDVTLSKLKEIAGPRLIGFLLNSMLYGSLGVQVYFYSQAFPKDKPFTKYLVYVLFLLETVQTVMIFRDCVVIFTDSLADPTQVNNPGLGWIDIAILDGITGCIVQNFFAYRIFMLSSSKIIPSVISIISFTQTLASLTNGILARMVPFTGMAQVASQSTCIWLIGSAVCDILITLSMTYHLSRCKSKVRQTRTLIKKLIRMTIETGSLTASVALIDVVTFMIKGQKYLAGSLISSTILAKLYSTTTLAILNGRRDLSYIDEMPTSGQPLSAIDFERIPGCNPDILTVLETDPTSTGSGTPV